MRAKPFPSGLVGLPLIKVSIFAPPTSLSLFPLKQKLKIEKYEASEVKDLDEGRLSSFSFLCFPSDKDAFSQSRLFVAPSSPLDFESY